MTKKPLKPLEDPPPATCSDDDEVESSSGEEDDDSSSEEEEEGSSSEEDEPIAPSAPIASSAAAVTIAVPGKPTVSATATEQGSGSETETDSDSEPEKALPVVVSGTKRPGEGTSREGNAKRAKKVTSGENEKKTGEGTKKQAFQRLWSEEDEIALLQGMLNFRKEKGKSPYNESYEFVKKWIQFEASKNQLMEKLRSLKKKYIGTWKNGKSVSFTKPHDVKALTLSMSIWGPEGICLESVAKTNEKSQRKTNGKSQRKTEKLDSVKQDLFSPLLNGKSVQEDLEPHKTSDWFESSFLVQSIAQFGVDEASVIQGWNSAPVESKKMIEERMRALRGKELEYLMLKTQFLHEVTSMMAGVLKQM